jgi:hypothetical protein
MRIALIAVLGVVVGCGDDGVSVGTNEDNFCDEIADVVCHNIYQCCTESEIAVAFTPRDGGGSVVLERSW